MKKTLIHNRLRSLLILMIFGLPLHAQEDTIVTVVGQRCGVTVQGFKDNPLDRYVKVSPYMDEKGLYVTRCPGGLVDRIIFADGFVLKMENGHVVRDNVTEAPRYTGGMTRIQLEGVLPLTKEETRRLLGQETFELGYIPYLRQTRMGLVKTAVSMPITGTMLAFGYKPDYRSGGPLLDGDNRVIGRYELGEQRPGNTILLFSAATTVSGLAEMALANLGIRRLAETFRDWSEPTVSASRMRVALGASLTACGAGLMVYGTHLMKTKTYWRNDYVYLEDGSEHLVSSQGKKAGPLWLWSLAGAVLVNAGTAELTYGFNCLRGHSLLRKAGLDGLTASFGPVPSGYGLTVRF